MHALDAVRDELSTMLPQASFAKARSIAVLLPCYNEEATITEVVHGFRAALPGATVYVYDNNSADRTAELARAAGAVVRREGRQGKGHVVRRMLADVDADVYVLADGDLTYDPRAAGRLIDQLVSGNLDMVVGRRVGADGSFPKGHRVGNLFFNKVVRMLFGAGFTDILSGYRVMSRRFAKSFPASSRGFEIETERTPAAALLRRLGRRPGARRRRLGAAASVHLLADWAGPTLSHRHTSRRHRPTRLHKPDVRHRAGGHQRGTSRGQADALPRPAGAYPALTRE